MKKILTALLLLFVVVGPSFGFQNQEIDAENGEGTKTKSRAAKTSIEDARTGSDMTIEELVKNLAQSDVVFLGEQHDNDSGHEFQLNVIKKLFEGGHSIAISTEQFERDVQGALNDYLSGKIDEKEFLSASRPWRNYQKHYRPIIEFAKSNRIPVVAANIPRRIASSISTGKPLSFLDEPYLPRETTAPKDAYWELFHSRMAGHMGVDGEAKMEKFYESQCMKDDAMAEAITDFIAVHDHDPKIVVHLCGQFHSDFGLGTVSRVQSRRPLLRTSIVSMELQDDSDDTKSEDLKSDLSKRAHFVFMAVKNQKNESRK